MPEFLSPVDIGNRALQRVGAQFMNPSLGFAEKSNRAAQVALCYGKLRRAELQRSVWTFATRRAAIRPIGFQTALLQPTLWSAAVTYFVGSIVADVRGTLWESTVRNNLGNQPGIDFLSWVPYFGPQTCELFHSSVFFTPPAVTTTPAFRLNTPQIAYHKSELVYTIKGDGTFNVYKSLVDGNGVHPALPNQWSVNTRYKLDDVVNVFPSWAVGTTYSQGQTVLYTDGNYYSSLINSNLGNVPPSSAADWALMPVLVLQTEFNFQTPSPFTTAPPFVPGTTPIDEWNTLATYNIGQFVIWNAATYVSLINNNTGNFPSNASDWAQCTGGTVYQSLVDFNLGNAPGSSPSQWTTTFTLGGGNSLWVQIGGAAFPNGVGINAFQLTYPIGSGPVQDTWSKNAYMLPANYLRRCAQDPSAGRVSLFGAPTNLSERDWVIESGFLVTTDAMPVTFRFVADVQNVAGTNGQQGFPDLFCEMLSCSIALEICEPLTQSTRKKSVIAQEYKFRRTEAITVDAIETGAEEPPLDDFITARQ